MEIPYSCWLDAGTGAANLTLSNTLASKALICGSIAFDTIMVFEGSLQAAHPSRQDPHAERLVPGAADAAGIRRLRRQHRLQPAVAGRRRLSDGDGRPGFRAVRRVDAQSGRADRSRQGDRERAHGAGFRDDRSGRQPDLGVSSGRDGQLAPEPRAGRRRQWRSASSRRTAATAWFSTRRNSRPRSVPFMFDPGQGLPMFDGEELRTFIAQATWVAVNDYEWQVLQQKTGWTAAEVLQQVEALIVTRGAEGSVIHTRQGEIVHSVRQARGRGRSDRLRRRLPRGPDSRPAARLRLGDDRAHRLAPRRDQDRDARHAEPPLHARASSSSATRLAFGHDTLPGQISIRSEIVQDLSS